MRKYNATLSFHVGNKLDVLFEMLFVAVVLLVRIHSLYK